MAQTMRFDGKTVIPIFISTPGYREWELTMDEHDYSIVNEQGDDGDWTLRQWIQDSSVASPPYQCWQDVARGLEVDAFLRTHALILGN